MLFSNVCCYFCCCCHDVVSRSHPPSPFCAIDFQVAVLTRPCSFFTWRSLFTLTATFNFRIFLSNFLHVWPHLYSNVHSSTTSVTCKFFRLSLSFLSSKTPFVPLSSYPLNTVLIDSLRNLLPTKIFVYSNIWSPQFVMFFSTSKFLTNYANIARIIHWSPSCLVILPDQ
jgi:hypothetical protein